MKFVFGRPHKLAEPCWYVILDCHEAEEFVARILNNKSAQFMCDPHKSDLSQRLAITIMSLAIEIDTGFHNRQGWYVGINGGMCPNLFEIIKDMESNTWPDKKQRININKWPNGKHFYAKVDDIDVSWDNKTKWSTRKAAEGAAIKFMKAKDKK